MGRKHSPGILVAQMATFPRDQYSGVLVVSSGQMRVLWPTTRQLSFSLSHIQFTFNKTMVMFVHLL